MKQKLGTGHRKGAALRPNTSQTSPRMIATRRRQAEALKLRERGLPYAEIGRMLKVNAATAFRHVLQAINDIVPAEVATHTLSLELQRLDALLEKYFPAALDGDQGAAKLVLKIEHQRARLCGLYPDTGKGGGVNVNIGTNGGTPDARQLGIQVTMVEFKADRTGEVVPPDFQLADPLKTIEHQPLAIDKPPVHLHSSTAPHPQSVPAVPPSPPRSGVVSKEPFPSQARESALFRNKSPGSWMGH
jgi:hypothetical protein